MRNKKCPVRRISERPDVGAGGQLRAPGIIFSAGAFSKRGGQRFSVFSKYLAQLWFVAASMGETLNQIFSSRPIFSEKVTTIITATVECFCRCNSDTIHGAAFLLFSRHKKAIPATIAGVCAASESYRAARTVFAEHVHINRQKYTSGHQYNSGDYRYLLVSIWYFPK